MLINVGVEGFPQVSGRREMITWHNVRTKVEPHKLMTGYSFPSCTQMVTPCGPRFRKSRLLTSPTTAASSSCSASRWPNTKTRGQLLLSRRSLKRCAWSALDGAPRSRNAQKNTANKQRRTISNPVFVLLHPPSPPTFYRSRSSTQRKA